MTLCAVFALCGGLALIRFAFFGIKYGLPHGEYPVQSIASFGGSTKNISLLAAYLILTVLRCFGSVYLAALLLFTSVYSCGSAVPSAKAHPSGSYTPSKKPQQPKSK